MEEQEAAGKMVTLAKETQSKREILINRQIDRQTNGCREREREGQNPGGDRGDSKREQASV